MFFVCSSCQDKEEPREHKVQGTVFQVPLYSGHPRQGEGGKIETVLTSRNKLTCRSREQLCRLHHAENPVRRASLQVRMAFSCHDNQFRISNGWPRTMNGAESLSEACKLRK
ncbi:hypothetical protein J6590_019551 [Homalodisca vitripennis]|nr:hypothetical protein J6590_019551 [Homalodisca vitripennis]